MSKPLFTVVALISILAFACKKDSEKGSPAVPFIFHAGFATGDSLIIKEGLSGTNSYGRAGGVIDVAGHYFEVQSTSFTGGGNKASVYFMKTFPSQPDTTGIRGIFHTGSYNFGSSVIDSLKDGVEIILVDTTGKKWSTAYGSQSGSSFSVTEHQKNDFDNFTPFITGGDFHCALYDTVGNSLHITSGSFIGRTVVYP